MSLLKNTHESLSNMYLLYLTEQLKSGLFDAMHNFDIEYTQMMAELRSEVFNNLYRQELMSERIWWLERSAAKMKEHTKTMVEEKLMKTRSELKGLLKRRKMLSSLVTGEKRWIEIMGEVGVRVFVAIVQSHSKLSRKAFVHALSSSTFNLPQPVLRHVSASIPRQSPYRPPSLSASAGCSFSWPLQLPSLKSKINSGNHQINIHQVRLPENRLHFFKSSLTLLFFSFH